MMRIQPPTSVWVFRMMVTIFLCCCGSLVAQGTGSDPRRDPRRGIPAPPAPAIERVKLGDLSASASLGPEDAPVTIVGFIDYQCPYCARAHATLEEVTRAYPKKVRIVFKHNPLSFHPHAGVAAEAALVAMVLGEFPPMHALMLDRQKELTRESLPEIAEAAGMDRETFSQALESGDFSGEVESDKKLAKQIGVTSTPFFFVNGRPVRGARPFVTFKSIIDEEIAGPKRPTRWVRQVAGSKQRNVTQRGGVEARPAGRGSELDKIVPATKNEALLIRHVVQLEREVESLRAEMRELRRSLGSVSGLLNQQRKAASASSFRRDRITTVGRVSLDDDPSLGHADAKIGIVAFADYGCPYSRKFARYVLPSIRERFIDTGKVRFIYRDRPVEYREESMRAAIIANCAGKQGAYWKMHDALYAVSGPLKDFDLNTLATKVGLDVNKFEECLSQPKASAEVEADIKEAESPALGLRVVPTLYIGKIQGNELIDARRVSGVQSVRTLTRVIESLVEAPGNSE